MHVNDNDRFNSALGPTISRYLALKRALGRRYAAESDVFRHLDRFLATANRANSDLTADTFIDWCQSQTHLTSGVRRFRMRVVRNLCLYRRRTEPRCFAPDASQFPPLHQPGQPYIFTESKITELIRATATLEPTSMSPLRPEVFRLATALLYTTGLRRGELLHMTVGDYDPRERTLLVRHTKFHKSRLLPLSDDATRELQTYLEARRARRISTEADVPLLWNRHRGGNAYTGVGLGDGFRTLFNITRILTPSGRLPRIHDFRHAFAVHALLRWYREGADVQARLPALATYMGHVSIVSTQYYLRFVEELAGCASERFARLCADLVIVPGGAQ